MIDSVLLLPSNMKVLLDNCTLKLSDESRDNMFRSDNVGRGITDPVGMILIGYVTGFELKNVNFENAHAWMVSFERTLHDDITDLTINNQ